WRQKSRPSPPSSPLARASDIAPHSSSKNSSGGCTAGAPPPTLCSRAPRPRAAGSGGEARPGEGPARASSPRVAPSSRNAGSPPGGRGARRACPRSARRTPVTGRGPHQGATRRRPGPPRPRAARGPRRSLAGRGRAARRRLAWPSPASLVAGPTRLRPPAKRLARAIAAIMAAAMADQLRDRDGARIGGRAGTSVVAAREGTRRYGEDATAVDALRGVSLDVRPGEVVAVMGPSGSGKSTLMHTLAGLDKPTSGSVEIGGEEITGMDDAKLTQLRRDHVGFVFQFFNLLPMLSAEENIVLPLTI